MQLPAQPTTLVLPSRHEPLLALLEALDQPSRVDDGSELAGEVFQQLPVAGAKPCRAQRKTLPI